MGPRAVMCPDSFVDCACVCYFRDIYPFIYFVIAMYVLISLYCIVLIGFYCILFRSFLIPKINVALQLTK